MGQNMRDSEQTVTYVCVSYAEPENVFGIATPVKVIRPLRDRVVYNGPPV